jgi:hypothetical protein
MADMPLTTTVAGVYPLGKAKKIVILLLAGLCFIGLSFNAFHPFGYDMALVWALMATCIAVIAWAAKIPVDQVVAIAGKLEFHRSQAPVQVFTLEEIVEWDIRMEYSSDSTATIKTGPDFSEANLTCRDSRGQTVCLHYSENRDLFRDVLNFLEVHKRQATRTDCSALESQFPTLEGDVRSILARWRRVAV